MRLLATFLLLTSSVLAQSGTGGDRTVTSAITVPQSSPIPSTFLAPGPIHPFGPIATVNVTFPNTSGYTALTATSFANLQTQINTAAASCDNGGGSGATGYVISMAQSSAFTTSSVPGLVLPVSTCTTDWIVVQTTGLSWTRGTRIDPSTAAGVVAQLTSTAINGEVISCSTNIPCNNYWFLGIELNCVSSGIGTCYAVDTPAGAPGQTDVPADLPNKLIFDHVYAHAHAITPATRLFFFNGNNLAIIDSWISDGHVIAQEAQAISGDSGGPWLYQNDFIEGAGENVLFGGSNIGGVNNTYGINPHDVTETHNWYYKPLQWYFLSSNPVYEGAHFDVKNIHEYKMCVRCLNEFNVYQNDWADGQNGVNLVQNGATSQDSFFSLQSDISYIYNHFIGGTGWLGSNAVDSINGRQNNDYRMEVSNNLWEDVGGNWGSFTTYQNIFAYHYALIFNHNTGTTAVPSFGLLQTTTFNRNGPFYYSNNITQHGTNGFNISTTSSGASDSLPTMKIALGAIQFPTIINNALQGMAAAAPGALALWNADTSPCGGVSCFSGNSAPVSMSNIGFVNATSPGGDYRLCTGVNLPAAPCAAASAYIAGGANGCQVNADGTGGNADCGADIATVLAQTAGVQTVPSLWPDSLSGGGISLSPTSLTCNGSNTVTITPVAGSNGGSTFVQSGLDVLFRGALVAPSISTTSSITFAPPTYSSAVTITNTSLTGNLATYTISIPTSPMKQGDQVTVTGTTNGGGVFNVTNAVVTGSNTSAFFVAITHANVTTAADSGTASGTSAVAVSNFGMPLTAALKCN